MKKLLGIALIVLGISCLAFAGFLIHERTNPKSVAFTNYPTTKIASQELTARPTKIRILSQQISLPIVPADIRNNQWDLSSTGVSYLTQSPIPGNYGNSILYGHNWTSLLGRLPQVKPGDMIDVQYENGQMKHFEVTFTAVVTPDQTSILAPSKDRRLTLYTCTGFLDTKRFVVVGILKS